MESKKVVHLRLFNPKPDQQQDYYFGSVAAIYDTFPSKLIGCNYEILRQRLFNGGKYRNQYVAINIGQLIRKKNKPR